MKIIKKILSILLLICTLTSNFTNIFAKSISESEKVNLIFDHDCISVLKIIGKDTLKQVPYVCYIDPDTGIKYPAFCVEPTKEGIGTGAGNSYDVILTDLSNPILWRMLYKGYVGTSYADWGLECDDDLYFATKTAVHCFADGSTPTSKYEIPHRVGYGDNTTLEDIRRRGAKVLQVSQAIYDYAYTSTENYIKASIQITKKGELYQSTINETNYLIQDYYIKSNKELSSYNVNISNFPTGTKILNSSNNNSYSMTNPNFKIAIPINNIIENFKGSINITNAKVKSFPIFYADSGNDATQNYIISDPSEITTSSTILNIDAYKSGIKILKIDNESNKPLEGVTFNIKYSNGTNIGNFTTDNNGTIFIEKLKQGQIVITEKSTLSEYILDTTPYETTIEYGKIQNITIQNNLKKGNLKIIKIDKENNNIFIPNIKFQLLDNNKNLINTYKTDENGEIFISNLNIGNYYLREINSSNSLYYPLNEDIRVTIDWNTTTTKFIENEPKKAQAIVIKVDENNNEIKLENVIFEVLDENGNILEKIKTNSDGKAITSSYAIKDFEKIYLREVKTNNNYVLSNNLIEVKLYPNKTTEVLITNKVKTGKIRIIKVNKDNNKILIPNVTFQIIDNSTNEIIDVVTTNENGTAVTKDLKITSTYTIKEIATDEKYNLNTNNIITNVEYNNIKNIIIENELKKGQLKIVKIDKDNNQIKLPGVIFEILDSDMNVIEELITDENGEAISSKLPCINKIYFIREKQTLNNYVLDNTLKEIILKSDEITNVIFENEKIKGYLEITKVDVKDENIKLKGTFFEIYDENNEVIQTLKTDENGKAISDLLVKGKYYLKEFNTGSAYYLLNKNTFEFEIINNNETVPITIKNEPVDIKVNIDKKGDIETKPNEIVHYTFSNIANESNTYLDSFKWFDYIPTDSVRIEKITTGTWNQELLYKIYYKTNKSNNYILYKDNLNTKEIYEINFSNSNFENGEFITEFYFDFGKADTGFKEVISPTLECKTLETLKNNSSFINSTKTIGNYNGIKSEANGKWTTIVHIPKKPDPVLPRTGK